MIPVTYGYARISKSDRDDRNLETQLRELANHGIREELIFSDVMIGRLMSRPVWGVLMARVLARVQPQLRRGREDPGGPHRPEHRHRGHQGRHRLHRRQRCGQVLSPDDDGRRCLPG